MTTPPPAPGRAASTPEAAQPLPIARRVRSVSAAAVLVTGTLLLSGCTLPDVASMSPDLPKKHAAAAPQATATPSATPAASRAAAPVPAPVTAAPVTTHVDRGDLAAGSLTRKLQAGSRTLVIDYWTDTAPSAITATAPTVLQMSAHIEDGDADHAVKVSRFVANLDDGTATTTLSDDRGEFVVTPPYSYGTALTVRATNPAATSASLSVEFDLLIETAPGSGAYFRQTVLDTIRIAFHPTGNSTEGASS
jgi:hypothetical protein